MENSIFLSDSGLTSTSAQHIKDMAGHYVDKIKSQLQGISFVNEEIALIGNSTRHSLSIGLSKEEVENLNELLKQVSEAQSLQAWLGEAIRAKSVLSTKVSRYSFTDYCVKHGLEFNYPDRPERMSEQEWIASLNIKERNEYLHLQTLCAVYGKFIHPKGALDKARNAAYDVLKNPISYRESGGDTIFHYYSITQPIEDIDKLFFDLQNTHREYQARFNSMKHQYELAADEKFAKELKEFEKIFNQIQNQEMEAREAYLKYKEELSLQVRQLKVVIPNDLKGIYTKISSLGK